LRRCTSSGVKRCILYQNMFVDHISITFRVPLYHFSRFTTRFISRFTNRIRCATTDTVARRNGYGGGMMEPYPIRRIRWHHGTISVAPRPIIRWHDENVSVVPRPIRWHDGTTHDRIRRGTTRHDDTVARRDTTIRWHDGPCV